VSELKEKWKREIKPGGEGNMGINPLTVATRMVPRRMTGTNSRTTTWESENVIAVAKPVTWLGNVQRKRKKQVQ
jgi:hypothetical protein